MFQILFSSERTINHCQFSKGSTICQEGGRYKLVSDGDNNNMIMLAITKVKTTDEGEYRVVVENEHGSDEKSFMLYVSGKYPCIFIIFLSILYTFSTNNA